MKVFRFLSVRFRAAHVDIFIMNDKKQSSKKQEMGFHTPGSGPTHRNPFEDDGRSESDELRDLWTRNSSDDSIYSSSGLFGTSEEAYAQTSESDVSRDERKTSFGDCQRLSETESRLLFESW